MLFFYLFRYNLQMEIFRISLNLGNPKMKKYELGEIISKILAIYILLNFFDILIGTAPGLILSENKHFTSVFMLISVSKICIDFALVLLFWFGARKIGNAIAGADAEKEISMLSPEHFMVVVFVTFCCIVFIHTIPDISKLIASKYYSVSYGINDLKETSIRVWVRIVFSLILIFGAIGFKNIIFRLRHYGTK